MLIDLLGRLGLPDLEEATGSGGGCYGLLAGDLRGWCIWRLSVVGRSARFRAMSRLPIKPLLFVLAAPAFAQSPEGVTVDDRYDVRVLARGDDHPVISPSSIGIDEDGSIYVVETHRFRYGVDDNRNREFWFMDDIASETTADRLAMYQRYVDRVPMDYYTERSEVVRRHEDTNGDGKIDRTQVFADGFNDPLDGTASGVFAFEGAVYFACIPHLWMLRDTSGDGTADERHVIADGFGVRVSFSGHDMNGFALGPDGRIYGTIGDRGFTVETREGRHYRHPDLGAVFRFDPDGSNFEVIHIGLRNPKEIAFDRLGNPVSVDNDADMGDRARIVYLTEGGDSGWRMGHQTMSSFHRWIGMDERPPNRWMDEKMWHERNAEQPLFMIPPVALLTSGPSGLTYHPGTGFCDSERGRFLICDYRGTPTVSGIWSFELAPRGAGLELADSRWFMQGAAATDVDYTWDGRVIVSDFIGGWRAHDDGRLLVVENPDAPALPDGHRPVAELVAEGFADRTADELSGLLDHPDMRVRLRAQIALTRHDDALELLSRATEGGREFTSRLHGVWGLGILARRGGGVPVPFPESTPVVDESVRAAASAVLAGMTEDADPQIRAQVWRVLGESPLAGDGLPITDALADEEARVRYFASFAAAKLGGGSHLDAVLEMLRENDDADVYLRHAGVVALESLADAAALAALAADDSPAVRISAVVALRRMNAPEVAVFLNDADALIVAEAIRAICDEDIRDGRPQVAAMLDDRESFGAWPMMMQRRLLHNAYRLGGEENARRILGVALDDALAGESRVEGARLLDIWTDPPQADQFLGDFAPLDARPSEQVIPVLTEVIADVLASDDLTASAGLDWTGTYGLDVDASQVLALVENRERAAELRAQALKVLLGGDDLVSVEALHAFATDSKDEVALMAMRGLATRDADAAVPGLREAIATPGSPRAREAWSLLGDLPGDEAEEMIALGVTELVGVTGAAPDALERLDAARKRADESPAIAATLRAYDDAVAASDDPLAPWLASLKGGDFRAGRRIFQSHPAGECRRCHQADSGHTPDGDAGPNLAGVANRQDARTLLESLVLPDAEIAPGYGTAIVTLENGGTVTGTYYGEEEAHLDLLAANGAQRILKSDIAETAFSPSSMPAMGDLLEAREIRDLVAWLGRQTGADAPAPAGAPESFEVFDPATVKPAGEPVVDAAAFRKLGQQQYIMCAACHGQQGEGGPAGPPLAGSEWVLGPEENLIRIQLRGLQGPIEVKGVEYNMVMAPMPYQTNEQIAAVLSFIRSSWGNEAPPVAPEAVEAFRDEVGEPMLRVEDLKPHGQ